MQYCEEHAGAVVIFDGKTCPLCDIEQEERDLNKEIVELEDQNSDLKYKNRQAFFFVVTRFAEDVLADCIRQGIFDLQTLIDHVIEDALPDEKIKKILVAIAEFEPEQAMRLAAKRGRKAK